METILITGGTGTIGMALSTLLKEKGYKVRHLSRSQPKNPTFSTFLWDLDKRKMDPAALEGVDHIIHLAGAGVGDKRWTSSRKQVILDSRIATAALLHDHVKAANIRLKSFISASGISYYGSSTTENIYQEKDPAGDDFLAEVSVKWEAAADQFNDCTDRIVKVRTGVVLSPTGGALEKLIKPIKMGIGSPLGSGKQYVPWLHLDDIVGIYLHILKNSEISGPINAVSNEHITNSGLTKAIAKQLNKKLWAPKVPGFLLKLLFGEMAVIILEGSRIDNQKIKDLGYQFEYSTLEDAVGDLV